MKKVCCFGEILLRLSPDTEGEWLQQNSLPVFIGGAELNVATALALWQLPVKYVSAAPANYLTRQLMQAVTQKGIDVSDFILSGDRIGSYYLAQGSDLKNAGVIYDRNYSSFAELKTGTIDWDKIFANASWFHLSAISPALNNNIAAVCEEGLKAANQKGIPTSIDLNYREKLWQHGRAPINVIPQLVQYCDVVMGNIWAADKMLGIPVSSVLGDDKNSYLQQAEATSIAIQQQFARCRQVANTFRFDIEDGIRYYASLYTNGKLYVSAQFEGNKIVDKIGSGDCFMAGLIYGNQRSLSPQKTIDFAAAAAYSKLFIKGDATTASVHDIESGLLSRSGKE